MVVNYFCPNYRSIINLVDPKTPDPKTPEVIAAEQREAPAQWQCKLNKLSTVGDLAGYVAGTLNSIQLSSIQFNRRSVNSTMINPGTDAREALEKLANLSRQEETLCTQVSIASVVLFMCNYEMDLILSVASLALLIFSIFSYYSQN